MVQCDECCASELLDEADHWALDDHGEDLCPDCADARALEAEHDLNIEGAA